jgi:type 1 glutamine amidotransferase/HEAT repeat protein
MRRQTGIQFTAVLLLCGALLAPATARGAESGVPADAREKIRAATPAKARVSPKKARRLLVFNLCKGFGHGAIPYGACALQVMGERTKAYETVVSEDPGVFAPDKLSQFDAVCFNNSTGELFTDAALKRSLLDFVKGGKGVVGIHAATDCFSQWAEYGEMMGGYFDGHPWGGDGTWPIRIEDPLHPLTAVFEGKGFEIRDEIYQIRDPYSRENLRVLLTLDPKKIDLNAAGINRKDKDFGVSWVRSYGQGRVFYCSLGHNPDVFWNPAILQFYLDGVQFALGDLKADTLPSAKLSEEYLRKSEAARAKQDLSAARETLRGSWNEILAYQFGQSRAKLTDLSDYVRDSHASPKARREIARTLAESLSDGKATRDYKSSACRELALIGSRREVPALARLLADDEMTDMARFALERIPGSAAGKALRKALKQISGKARTGVINSLGVRRDERAIRRLVPLLDDADRETAQAAAAALGRIGGTRATGTLMKAWVKGSPSQRARVADPCLACADQFLEAGKAKKAAAIFERFYAEGESVPVRQGALAGLAAIGGPRGLDVVKEALAGDDAAMNHAALRHVRLIQAEGATETFAGMLKDLPNERQALLLEALADRGDAAALPAATEAAQSNDPTVRIAALRALAPLGDVGTVELLARTAAKTEDAERDAARASLDRLRGGAVDSQLLKVLRQAREERNLNLGLEAIRSLGERNAKAAVPTLLTVAEESVPEARKESMKTLALLADRQQMPKILEILVGADDADQRKAAEDAVVAVARRIGEGEKPAREALAAYSAVSSAGARASLLRVLGRIGDNDALDALRGAVKDADADVRDAAIRALADWPNAAPLADLAEIARLTDQQTHQALALRGYLRMVSLPSERPPSETLEMLKQGMKIAKRPDEQKLALNGLGQVRTVAALEFAAQHFAKPDLQAEAIQAALTIADETQKSEAEATKKTLEKALAAARDEELRKKVQSVLEKMGTSLK